VALRPDAVGADVDSGLTHTVSVTAAKAADISQRPDLREGDRAVFGDKGYVGQADPAEARRAGVYGAVALTASKPHPLTAANRRPNRRWSRTRSRMEPLFRVIQWPLGYTQVRYPGLAKNAAQVFTLIGLTNLYRVRRRLLA